MAKFYHELTYALENVEKSYERIISNLSDAHYRKIVDEQNIEGHLVSLSAYLEESRNYLEMNVEKICAASPHIQEFIENVKVNTQPLTNIQPDYNSVVELKNRLQQIQQIAERLITELSRVPILTKLVVSDEQSVVLVGANGSGKSSLADFLKDSFSNNIIVVPAQKYLYIKSSPFLKQMSESDALTLQSQQRLRNSREIDDTFTKVIAALINDHYQAIDDNISKSEGYLEGDIVESRFDSLKAIWSVLFPEIKIATDYKERSIKAIKNSNSYSLNEMSDGEKSVIYYISQVLFAPENSIVIIDEPENHLNLSIVMKLWDYLVQTRQTCKFVFISHTVEFITSRRNAKLVWCKNYTYPKSWDLEIINEEGIPKELLVELLGSKKPILFCEGDKSGLDYNIYGSLFFEEFTVLAVGGKAQVREYNRVYNGTELQIAGASVAIIDSDSIPAEEVEILRNRRVYVLPFNEIEMLLLCDEVMESTLYNIIPADEASERINAFKKAFWHEVSLGKEIIALTITKTRLDDLVASFRISKIDTIGDIRNDYKTIQEADVDKIMQVELGKINQIITSKDYNSLLAMCPLKHQILRGLANRHLESDYEDKAVFRLQKDKNLQATIRNKYFSELLADTTQGN